MFPVSQKVVALQGGVVPSDLPFQLTSIESYFNALPPYVSTTNANPLTPIARALDSKDPYPEIRALFGDAPVKVAAGHSLGRPVAASESAVLDVFNRIVRSDEAPHAIHWNRNDTELKDHGFGFKLYLHEPSRRVLSRMLGGRAENIMLGNGLSDDLIRLVESLFHIQVFGKRNKILCLKYDFNSDLTIVRTFLKKSIVNALQTIDPSQLQETARREHETLAAVFLNKDIREAEQFDYIEKHFMIMIPPIPESAGRYDNEQIKTNILAHHDSLAGSLLPSIVFDTGQLLNIHDINGALIDHGIPGVWDCAHSVGNVVHTFEEDKVLAAVGCGYKHLNGLPGGPGFVYQDRYRLEAMSRTFDHIRATPVSGWLANGKTGDFDTFEFINRFNTDILHPAESVERLRASNPDTLGLKVLIANLSLFASQDFDTLMVRKDMLADFLQYSLNYVFKEDTRFRFITPTDKSQRGATFCISLNQVDAEKIETMLRDDQLQIGKRFEIDVRPGKDGAPATIRITAHHCHMSFQDTADLAYALKKVADHPDAIMHTA